MRALAGDDRAAPPPPTPLPAIPTLLVSGEYDVTTPAALANVEAARIPGATSLVVPGPATSRC